MMRGDEIDTLSPRVVRETVRVFESGERRADMRAAMVIQARPAPKPWEVFASLADCRPMPKTPEELEAKIMAALGV